MSCHRQSKDFGLGFKADLVDQNLSLGVFFINKGLKEGRGVQVIRIHDAS